MDPNLETFAKELMDSCYETWIKTPTGLAPETWSWIDKQQNIKVYPETMQNYMVKNGFMALDTGYDLRPGK